MEERERERTLSKKNLENSFQHENSSIDLQAWGQHLCLLGIQKDGV